MAVNLLKKNSLALVASLLLAGHVTGNGTAEQFL